MAGNRTGIGKRIRTLLLSLDSGLGLAGGSLLLRHFG